MTGSIEELERLAATSNLIIDGKAISNVALVNIIQIAKANGGTITLTNIKGKSIEALEELGKAGGLTVVFDTR